MPHLPEIPFTDLGVSHGVKSITNSAWHPGELAPQLFYIAETLSGMAVAVPRTHGLPQEWEALDMRCEPGPDCPILLGSFGTMELAKRRVEEFFGIWIH